VRSETLPEFAERVVPTSAPAAESEGGEPEVLEAPDPDSLWDQLLMERNSLAARLEASRARLAACEERCKAMERVVHWARVEARDGTALGDAFKELDALLAPKAEGGGDGD